MFAKMMEHYGNRTKGLLGSWTNKEIASNNKNLGKINELTAQGMPLEEAIHHAWTAEQLVPYNMTKAEIKLAEGIPGKYTTLYVLFTKP